MAIILIIAAIGILNLVKSCMAANESSADGSVRTVNTGEVTYSASYPAVGFSVTLVEFNTGALCAGGTGIIDSVLSGAAAAKSGYTFLYTVQATDGLKTTCTITATPMTIGTTGQRQFCPNQTGVIRYTLNGAGCAAPGSPALQ